MKMVRVTILTRWIFGIIIYTQEQFTTDEEGNTIDIFANFTTEAVDKTRTKYSQEPYTATFTYPEETNFTTGVADAGSNRPRCVDINKVITNFALMASNLICLLPQYS